MSVILIDEFEFPSVSSPGNQEVYKINFDNSSALFTVLYTGFDGEKPTVTLLERGRPDNAAAGNILSADGTLIYELKVTFNTPFAYIASTSPNTPNPPTCDLDIISVIVTPETQQGASDGSIVAVATSSFPNVEYSLDNVTFQSSGSFAGLSPGNYIVYVKDDNGCTRQSPAAVEGFNNPISGGFTSGLPVVQVSANNISKWSAAYNPIVINFQRNDNHIVSVTDAGGGYIDVKINGLYDSDQITLALTTAVVVKGSKYDINKNAFSHSTDSGQSVLRFQSAYFGSDTGVVFIEQSKPNYNIEVQMTSSKTPYTSETVTGSWSPNLSGQIRADLSEYVQSLVNAEDRFKYDVLNWKDADRGASYTIRYREVWDGSDNTWYDAPYPLYVVYAAMQLGQKYGGNMAEYVPFYNEPNTALKAKFMTDFPTPKYWVGLPWDISFIFSESIVGSEIKLRTTSLDINGELVAGGELNSFLLNTDAGYLMASDTGRFIIQEGALPPVDEEDLIEALGVNRLMMPGEPGIDVEYLELQLYRGEDDAPVFVTQPVLVKAERPCDNDPYIYLKWLNKLGGWNYWRFGFNQDYSLNVTNETVIRKNVFDWENDQTIFDVVKKSSNKVVEFGDSFISTDYMEGMRGLPDAIRVQMLVNNNPYKWQTVRLVPGSLRLNSTRNDLFEVNFRIDMAETNIQRQ